MKSERDSCFYMANLGSEVTRALAFRDRGELEAVASAVNRALKILEKVSELEEMRPRRPEILILKNLLLRLDYVSPADSLHLKNYFHPFAMRTMSASN